MENSSIPTDPTAVTLLLIETLGQEILDAEAPKWVAALQKDIDNLNGLHIVKRDLYKALIIIINETQRLID